jgi:hypothetical protein
MRSLAAGLGMAMVMATPVWAKDILVSYGPEETVYGSCRPALTLVNRSIDALDYVQVTMRYILRDGSMVEAEQKSRYRDGLADPVAPGGTRLLSIHHDESVPLGVPCRDIVAAQVVSLQCQTMAPSLCGPLMDIAPGDRLALPPR